MRVQGVTSSLYYLCRAFEGFCAEFVEGVLMSFRYTPDLRIKHENLNPTVSAP